MATGISVEAGHGCRGNFASPAWLRRVFFALLQMALMPPECPVCDLQIEVAAKGNQTTSIGCLQLMNSRKDYVVAYLRECLESLRRSQGEPQWRIPILQMEFRVTSNENPVEGGNRGLVERFSEQQRIDYESIGGREEGH
ncbi:hypothetical protein [Azohydromonas lata]|uniref:Uncharacterized protein n=1 Tax=Azohydromonas lata TaxID=45677 RepID=A0ABU5IIR9_9BURK|nr:hypothetical protein [Azohydromonas lata]MDZ5457938.1 hypothetical protein [Azohydromonas lata]